VTSGEPYNDDAHYVRLADRMQQSNRRELHRLYSDLYRQEREHPEWIDVGGEG
jgi:hypothetical protein